MTVAQVFTRSATIPAGTPADAPVTVAVTIDPGQVSYIRWQVPPGPSGDLGWALTDPSGVQIIPAHSGWIVTDDQADTWWLTTAIDGGDWAVTGYNTGTYDHTVYLEFGVNPVPNPVTPPAPAQPSAGVLALAGLTGTSGVVAGGG